MPAKSHCTFSNITSEDPLLTKKLLHLGLTYAGEDEPEKSEELKMNFLQIVKESNISADDAKLLWLDFLQLTSTPGYLIEKMYLETIFELKDDKKMGDHLSDFIENAEL